VPNHIENHEAQPISQYFDSTGGVYKETGVFLIFYISLSLNRIFSNTLYDYFPYIIKSEIKILTRFILAQSIKLSNLGELLGFSRVGIGRRTAVSKNTAHRVL
jgi:hypothetical protein